MEQVRREPRQKKTGRSRRRWISLAAAAACLVLIVVGFQVGNTMKPAAVLPEDEDAAAEISFTYNGVYVGNATVRVVEQVSGNSPTDSGAGTPGNTGSSNTDPSQNRIYINVRLVLIGVVSAYLLLSFLVWLITLLRNYSFSSQRKDRKRRRKRHTHESIDYDRYSRKDPEGF